MRKSDKKFDNELRRLLTQICENDFALIQGFQWLTHTVNYSNISSSLRVICVFDTNDNLQLFLSSYDKAKIESVILKVISQLNVKLQSTSKQLIFDSEENCTRDNNGNWAQRLG